MHASTFGTPGMPPIQAVASGDRVAQSQFGFNPIVTGLVIGKPTPRAFLGERLFRAIDAQALQVRVPVMGDEHRITRNTERALRAAYQHSDRDVDDVVKQLKRHSWATLADVDEIANAANIASRFGQTVPLHTREAKARQAEMVVAMGMESRRAEIAVAAASYSAATPDLDVTLAGGSEWDAAGGDSRADIQALAQTLASTNLVTINEIDAYLSNDAYQAAINDPVYVAKLSSTTANPGNTDQLAAYWGIGSVTVGDAYEFDPSTGNHASLYGDVCILRVSQNISAIYDTEVGASDSFVRFTNQGQAIDPWIEYMISSWVFPWDAWELADQVDTTAAAIIRNCKA